MVTQQVPVPAASGDEAASGWEDFGQQVDLTARLREILINYPEGTSIAKELVQNADDSGAQRLAFCLDRRHHGADSTLSPAMSAWQGPALLVYNDSVFSEQDFASISRIGDSVKRAQAGKTGRFGVGFNSVYHLTDVPSFVSGRHVVIFDPHCRYVPNASSSNPGKKIDFVGQHAAVQQYKDQLQPYQAFGCDPLQVGAHGLAEPWQGTLFRFPLRNADLAACSRISKQVYDVPKAQQLLLGLRSEATLMLLFLKSVHTLEVWDWAPGALAPIVQFSCAVGNASVQLHHERALFTRASAAAMAAAAAAAVQAGGGGGGGGFGTARSPDGCESSFELLLTSTHHVPDAAGANVATRTRTFLVCQGAAGGATASLAMQLSSNLASPLVPWGAVAADITPPGTPDGSNGDADGCGGHREGRAFCFLPLPARTGLPLHVNGFFELSSNRRDVWHGADLAGSGAQRAKWNEALLENAIAPAYARLLALAAARLGPGEAYARLWPTADAPAPWQRVVTELFRLVADMPVAWTDALGGKWLAPSQVVLPDSACATAEGGAALRGALVAAGVPLLCLPPAVGVMMAAHSPRPPRAVTPAMARTVLVHAAPRRAAPLAVQHVPKLLDYCLSDVVPDGGSAEQLQGLPLLPLRDGSVAAIQPRAQARKRMLPPHARAVATAA